MMKTFEAMLAAVVIISTLALLASPMFMAETRYSELRKAIERMLLSLSDKDEFRTLVLGVKDENSLNALKEYMDPYIDYPFELEVCDENNNCWGSKPAVKNYVAVTYLLDGNLTDYNIMKIKVYSWIFRSE
ncbi:MAG: hypothetical protein DRO07_00310 [Candidatus Iainarchaeum archaeon]|uniref:Uncharacterized protein n=1 Tax=Candidatus Iainarchaeum sp. TaxID=3101447 RepID=A0A497JHU2_9ARCH|nr:MAG: hypothetical protein DRO07_00310 [Candidatus Diapherotrites archaeon]